MAANLRTQSLQNSLKAMQTVFAGVEGYRVLGSILVASINGKPHRELHDIDLLIDETIYDKVVERFKKSGFKKVTKKAPGFQWDEFTKPNHLTFGILLRGRFEKDYFEYKAGRWLKLQVKNDYLSPTKYTLYNLPVRGIPLRSVYEGIKAANLNKKRQVDRSIVRKAMGENTDEGLSLNQAFRVKIFGVSVPFLYSIFSQVYNLIGGVRLRLGKSYDPWT